MLMHKLKDFYRSKSTGSHFLLITAIHLVVSMGLLLLAALLRFKTEKGLGIFLPASALFVLVGLLIYIASVVLFSRREPTRFFSQFVPKTISNPNTVIPLFVILCNLFTIAIAVIAFLNIRLFGQAYLGFLPMLFLIFSETGTCIYFLYRQSKAVTVFCKDLLKLSPAQISLLGLFLLGSTLLGISLSNVLWIKVFPTFYVTTNEDLLSHILRVITILVIFNGFMITVHLLTKISPMLSKIQRSSKLHQVRSIQPLKSNKPLLSFLITALFFVAVGLLFQIKYETNDDIIMIQLVSGYIGGTPQEFSVFSNVLLGMLYRFLFSINGDINWVVCFYVVVNYFSIWGLIYSFLVNKAVLPIKAFGVISVLLFDAYFITNITFTTIATTAAISGLMLVVPELLKRTRSSRLIFGFVLVMAGCLIRVEAVLMVFALCIPFLLFNNKRFLNRQVLLTLIAPAVLVSSAVVVNAIYLQAHPDWQRYVEYNKEHHQLWDTPRREVLGDYLSLQESIGWSANDAILFHYWIKIDQQVFSIDKIHYLVENISNWDQDPGYALTKLQKLISKEPVTSCLFILCAAMILLLLTSEDIKQVAIMFLTLFCVFLILFVLAWGYKIPNRVSIPLFFMFSTILLLMPGWLRGMDGDLSSSRSINKSPTIFLGGIICFLTMFFLSGNLLVQLAKEKNDVASRQRLYEQYTDEMDIVIDAGVFSEQSLILAPNANFPFHTMNPFSMKFPKVKVLTGGWNRFSPAYEDEFDQRGFSLDPTSFIGLANFYIGIKASFIPKLELYYLEHYDLDVKCEKIYTLGQSIGIDENIDPFVVLKLVQS